MDWSQLFYSPLNDPRYSSDVFRYSTGGASPQLRGAASQLMTGNEGTVMANMARQGAERDAQDAYRRAGALMTAGGGGGNYNALSSILGNLQSGVNQAASSAYEKGAQINQQGVAEGGRLAAQGDQLDQTGKNQSLEYLSRMKQEQIAPGNLGILKNLDMGLTPGGQQGPEGWLPSILKSVVGAGLSGLGGLGLGWLGDQIFGTNPYPKPTR